MSRLMTTDDNVSRALAQSLGHESPFTENELAALDVPLHVRGARDIAVLARCERLRKLHLHACEVTSLDVVAHLPNLESLRVTCSTVVDIAALAHCPALVELELAFDLVADARPIQALSNLRRAVILGNPLDEHSYREVLIPLHEHGHPMVVEIPMQYSWRLTRKLDAAGLAAVFDIYDGLPYLVRPGLTTAQGVDAEILQVPSSHVVNALTRMQSRSESPSWLLETLFDEHLSRARFPRDRQRIVGNAQDAQVWIAGSTLPEHIRRALSLLVQRFPRIQYARLTRARIEAWQGQAGVTLPAWLVDILVVLTDLVPGQQSSVRFEHFDHESPRVASLDRVWYQLGLTTPVAQHRTVVDHSGYLAIGMWLETGRSNLAINIRDPEDPRIYEYSIDDVSERGLAQRPRVVFDTYVSMLGHIRSIQLGGAKSDPPRERIIERVGRA